MAEFYVITGYKEISARPRKRSGILIGSYLAWKAGADDDFLIETGDITGRIDMDDFYKIMRALRPCTLVKISAEKDSNTFTLHEILESDIKTDAKANSTIADLKSPVAIQDEVFGTLLLDKTTNVFRCQLKTQVWVFLSVIDEKGIPTAHKIAENLDDMVGEAVRFAKKELKGKLKKPEYLYLRNVDVKEAGEFLLKFEHDDPVRAHSGEMLNLPHVVMVSGTIEAGMKNVKANF